MRWCFYRRYLVADAAVNNVVFVLLLLQPLPVVVVVVVVVYYYLCTAAILAIRMALNMTRENAIISTDDYHSDECL